MEGKTVATNIFKTLLPGLMIVTAVAITAMLIANRPQNQLAAAEERTLLVDVAEVHLQDLRIPIQAQGTVAPHRDTTMVSEVGGKIIEVSPAFTAGGFIAEGDVLLRIDDRDYQAKLLRAKAALETAESNLAQEKGRVEVARREWERLPKTTQRSKEASDLYLRKPQLEQAQAQLFSAQADLRKAGDDLERTILRAPYDCLIQEKRSDLGQYVTPGTPVVRVFPVDYAEVRLAIPQSRLTYLDLPGVTGYTKEEAPPVDLYTDISGVVTHWPAHLYRSEATLDERSRVLFVVARIDDPYALQVGDQQPLRIGSFVKANILGREMSDLVILPRYVLRAGNQLWVVDEQMRLRNREVSTLRTQGDEIFVTGGLQQGDLVSLTSFSDALPGMAVRINSRSSTLRQQQPALEAAGTAGEDPTEASDESTPDQTSHTEEVADRAA
jgi:RND family efflux transporter MFP subunit